MTGREPQGRIVGARTSPTQRQTAEVGGSADRLAPHELGSADLYSGADLLVLALTGGSIFRVTRALDELGARGEIESRPVLVSGWVGIVYEKHIDGFLLRAGADLLCVNSQRDLALFRDVSIALGIDDSKLLVTGFPDAVSPRAVEIRDVRTLTFVVQPSVPARRDERTWLLARLARYARSHADRNVVVKLRARPAEQTTHPEDFHLERLARGMTLPTNVEFAYGPMSEVLDRTDLCVTVSSTAAVEALARGIPTAVLTDFGIREELGNHWFVGSGLLTGFDALERDQIPLPDADWLADNGLAEGNSFADAKRRCSELLASRREAPLARPQLFYGEAIAPALRARLDVAAAEPAKTLVRRAVHWIARGPAYRVYRRLATWADAG